MSVDQIIAYAGGVMALSKIAGVDHSTVIGWRKAKRIPVERARRIHDATGIPLADIRPDVWDKLPQDAA